MRFLPLPFEQLVELANRQDPGATRQCLRDLAARHTLVVDDGTTYHAGDYLRLIDRLDDEKPTSR